MGNATVARMGGTIGRSTEGDAARASCRQMPLSFLKCGESATVAKVRDKGDLRRHLETLGFVEGARVAVLSEAGGDLIVEVKGSQVALDRTVAKRIVARA